MSLKPGLGVAFQVYFDIEIGGEKAGACILPPSTLVGFYLVRLQVQHKKWGPDAQVSAGSCDLTTDHSSSLRAHRDGPVRQRRAQDCGELPRTVVSAFPTLTRCGPSVGGKQLQLT